VRCPFCNAHATKVTDSRLAAEGDQVRRRRECLSCKERFTTYESAQLNLPRVIKSDGVRVPFDDAKLISGMNKALEKRPVSSHDIDLAVNRIKRKILAAGAKEIATRKIGHWVMQELEGLDEVAYVRFASVYRSFQDVSAFQEEIERLLNQPGPQERRKQLQLLSDEIDGNS